MRPYPPTPGSAAWGGCCHPADRQCDRCRAALPPPCPEPCACSSQPPHRPFPPKGFLLPRVLASDRVWLRRTCVTLNVRDLPTCAAPPLTLLSLRQGCQEPRRETLASSKPAPALRLALTLPVDCQAPDANGCLYTGHTEISVEAALRLSFPACECWRNSLTLSLHPAGAMRRRQLQRLLRGRGRGTGGALHDPLGALHGGRSQACLSRSAADPQPRIP